MSEIGPVWFISIARFETGPSKGCMSSLSQDKGGLGSGIIASLANNAGFGPGLS